MSYSIVHARRQGDAERHALSCRLLLDRAQSPRLRGDHCALGPMSAPAVPRPLAASQWDALLPVLDIDVGAVVRVVLGTADEFLLAAVIERDEFEAIVAPLSEELELAAEWDLFVGPQGIGWPAVAEVWNAGAVLLEQVEETIGHLSDEDAQRLGDLYEASLDGTRTSLPREWTGAPITGGEDPRILHQEEAFEFARTYYVPASTFTDVGSLPSLLEQCASERNLTLHDVQDRLAEDAPWLSAMANRTVDLPAEAPATILVRVLKELDIPICRRVVDLVHRQAYQTSSGSYPSAARLARRRRGVASRVAAPTAEERQAAALSYVQGLAKAARS